MAMKPRWGQTKRAIGAALVVLGASQFALADGRFLSPARGDVLAAGTTVEVRWNTPSPDAAEPSESELLLSVDGGLTFPIRITPEIPARAGSFRWQVPSIEAAHARLALRTGAGEQSESERLSFVGDEFAIVRASGDLPAALVEGTREWWTPQALSGQGAEDPPFESLAGVAEQIVAPDRLTDLSEPTPPCLTLPRLSATGGPDCPAASRAFTALPAAARSSAPLPLRL